VTKFQTEKKNNPTVLYAAGKCAAERSDIAGRVNGSFESRLAVIVI